MNKSETLTITDLTQSGEGVGHLEGITVFVDGTQPGEVIELEIIERKKNYLRGKATSIVKEAEDSINPPCAYYGQCGGCAWMHLSYDAQLKQKEKIVSDALMRIGKFSDYEIQPIIGMRTPFHYRNKAQYKVDDKGIGFYAKGSHKVVPIEDCLTQHESCKAVLSVFNAFIQKNNMTIYDEDTGKGYLRGIVQRTNESGECMLIIIINKKSIRFQTEMVEAILAGVPNVTSIAVNFNTEKTNRVMGRRFVHLYGKPYLTEMIGDLTYRISPASFFQVNTKQTHVLYDRIKTFANPKPEDTLLDLYCGTGTIGLYLAKSVKRVYGIEVVSEAIADAKTNAKLNAIDNADFLEGRVEFEIERVLNSGITPDIIIVDPPRKGCDEEVLESILKTKAERLIYVSCNPATLARDLRTLCQSYEITEMQPIDLFPHTGHIETVVLLSRKMAGSEVL